MLYANKCSHRDEIYRQRLQLFEKKTTAEIIDFIKVDANLVKLIKHENFSSIIDDFKKFKEKFCPFEMLKQIEQSFQKIEQTKKMVLGDKYALCADDLITLTIILVLINQIPQLGAELSILESLMAGDMEKIMHQQSGYCFTTLKVTHFEIEIF
jgi:amyotrophic lateral sclerosis 2 protein